MSKGPTPRIDLDVNPPDYETPLPSPPRVPSDIEQLQRPDIIERDTGPTIGQSGEHAVMHEVTDESTPPDGPLALRAVLKQLKKFDQGFGEMKGHCRDAADRSLLTLSEVQSLTGKFAALEKRVTAIELADRWVPRLAWLVTTCIAIIALLRTFKS